MYAGKDKREEKIESAERGIRVGKIGKGMGRGERAIGKCEAEYETISEESGERMVAREECENACNLGRMGDMYKILKEIGRKEWKAPPSVGITVVEFKEHFEKVSEMRYEVDPAVIGRVIGKCEI